MKASNLCCETTKPPLIVTTMFYCLHVLFCYCFWDVFFYATCKAVCIFQKFNCLVLSIFPHCVWSHQNQTCWMSYMKGLWVDYLLQPQAWILFFLNNILLIFIFKSEHIWLESIICHRKQATVVFCGINTQADINKYKSYLKQNLKWLV